MFKNVSKEELIVPASMAYLKEIRDFIEQAGKKYRLADKVTNSFKLVIDEACTNVIRHGYMDIKDGMITIRVIIRRQSITMVIVDQGKHFDPRKAQNPDLENYVRIGRKGGLGIHMMRKLMDDIQYNLTRDGNELRLTKHREAPVHEQPIMAWFEGLSLRRKFFLLSGALGALLALASFIFLQYRTSSSVRSDVYAEATATASNFAASNWDLLLEENSPLLNENAQIVRSSSNTLLEKAVITNSGLEILAISPFVVERLGQKFDTSVLNVLETRDDVTIYEAAGDSTLLYFIAPVKLQNVDDEPLGYAVVSLNENKISNLIASERNRSLLFVLILFTLIMAIVAFLVTQITQPFHKLAEWVRQVGAGQADQDEIDIDAGDEVGEIAVAFNEMTNKFREAQTSVIEQQRMHKELQVAQEIQQMLLPDDFPEVVGYDIASYYQSAKEVGGDLFDFVEVDDQSIGVCVADVSGKGIPGSLVMTMIRTSLRLETRGNSNPADILAKVNRFVTDDIRRGMFVTMFYVILDSRERIVSFSSAGHNPMILFRGKSKETFYLNPSGFPVGITLPDIKLFGERIQADRIRLHPDDVLVLYTDGITEAMNQQRDLYGEERFLKAIRRYGSLDVVEFVKAIKDDIMNFTQGFDQNDDITLVAIKENMAAVDVKVNTFQKLFEEIKNKEDSQTVADVCKEAGVSPTTFYRYRRILQEGGYDLLREMLHGYTNLGLRHLSIEVKTKMYDIIREYPEFGPKKISDALNTEKYGFTEISSNLIYEELKRAKLNTKERRGAFVDRGGKQRLKPPGTPLLTLDGEVLVGFRSEDNAGSGSPFMPDLPPDSRAREKMISARGKKLEEVEVSEPDPAQSKSKMLPSPPKRNGGLLDDESDDE